MQKDLLQQVALHLTLPVLFIPPKSSVKIFILPRVVIVVLPGIAITLSFIVIILTKVFAPRQNTPCLHCLRPLGANHAYATAAPKAACPSFAADSIPSRFCASDTR